MPLAPDECLGGILGEMAIHDLPAMVPAGDGVVVEFAKDVPLVIFVEIEEAAFPVCHDLVIHFTALVII
ncbi:hypothetical protein D3C80_1989200 [compost metagenome]